jgi:3-methyladenine DNA glycosylase AlkD
MNVNQIIDILRNNANPANVAGMARFGINTHNTLGISMPFIRKMAKQIQKEKKINHHLLAADLWISGIHEARILAALIEKPEQITIEQAENWIQDFDSWDVCDQVCMNLLDKTDFAVPLTISLTERKSEFVKRAGFALIASLSVHRQDLKNDVFLEFLQLIVRESIDERNFVKKAVNWALRQIGKRNEFLNEIAIVTCNNILMENIHSRSARWIANDALRELTNEKIQSRILHKKK